MERKTANLLNHVVLGGNMNRYNQEPARSDTALYRIQFQGRFDNGWSDWFDQCSLSVVFDQETSITTLVGFVADQAALHGVLAQIRDLGLKLILVEQISVPPNPPL